MSRRTAEEILAMHREGRYRDSGMSQRVDESTDEWQERTGGNRWDNAEGALDRHTAARINAVAEEQALNAAFRSYLRFGAGDDLRDRYRRILQQYTAENRDQSVSVNTAGGFLAPSGFLDKLTMGLKRSSAMVRAANIIETSTGTALPWPTTDDTANVGFIVAENNAPTQQDATFGQKRVGSFMYSSGFVKGSVQLAQDAVFDLESWLATLLGRRIGRAINAHFTNGTGGGTQPTGLIPNATVGVVAPTGSTATVTLATLVDLIFSVEQEYVEPYDEPDQAGGFTGFMTSPAGLRMLRKTVDSAGAPIVTQGVPPTVLGYPVMINPDFPVPAANAKSIAFGNFHAGYLIRSVRQQAVKRLNERFGDTLQLGWVGYGRYDGTPDDSAAVKLLQHSAT